jgi:hypothetical protein
MTECIIEYNKPIIYLYNLIGIGKETQEIIDNLLSIVDIDTININLKITLHKCFHILNIRGYDLRKYQHLVRKISDICSFSCSEIH